MKRFILLSVIVLSVFSLARTAEVAAQITSPDNPDVASLKATHERMLKAWSDRDIETIVEICNGAVGFGHSTAFPRPIRVEGPFRKGLAEFYSMMDVFSISLISADYMVVDNTGVAWGHLSIRPSRRMAPGA